MSCVLDIADLQVQFAGGIEAVRGVSLAVRRGETHCLVGESGCGKSTIALAVMNLLPPGARRRATQLRLSGQDLMGLPERRMAALRGAQMAMIFQDPLSSLNPAITIGAQMTEVLVRHRGWDRGRSRDRAADLLGRVGIAAAGMRLAQYPHQLSGGLRQRVMIAMALLCEPALLIADEPTTALDVTVQAQILRLLLQLQQELGLAMLLISHDLGVVSRMATAVSVMYAGEIIETAAVAKLFAAPGHPYTRGLLASVPVPGRRGEKAGFIPGTVPRIAPGFAGCAFRARCDDAMEACARTVPRQVRGPDHSYFCRLPPDRAP